MKFKEIICKFGGHKPDHLTNWGYIPIDNNDTIRWGVEEWEEIICSRCGKLLGTRDINEHGYGGE